MKGWILRLEYISEHINQPELVMALVYEMKAFSGDQPSQK